jgi:hypothetical protein
MMGRAVRLLVLALLGCGSAVSNAPVAGVAAPMGPAVVPTPTNPDQARRPEDRPNPERIVMLSPEDGNARRRADGNTAPPRTLVISDPGLPPGFVHWGLYKVCVDYEGVVFKVTTIKSANQQLDHDWSELARTWVYTPYAVDGQPTAFCYPTRFELRPE